MMSPAARKAAAHPLRSVGFTPLPVLACVLLALVAGGCSQPEPSGQVVAIVNGHDVTRRDMQAQAAVVRGDENALLQTVIDRALISEAARRRGLELDPAFLNDLRLAEQELLTEALERQIGRSLRVPTDLELQRFAESRPWAFRQRAVLRLAPLDPAGAGGAVDLDTADLDEEAGAGMRGDPAAAGDTIALKGKSFRVLARVPAPVPEQLILPRAREVWKREAIRTALAALLADERAKAEIRYQKGYGPGKDCCSVR